MLEKVLVLFCGDMKIMCKDFGGMALQYEHSERAVRILLYEALVLVVK